MEVYQSYCSNCKKYITLETIFEKKQYCKNCDNPIGRVKEYDGYVYILWSEMIPTLYKVGMTTRSVKERVKELSSSTGVPTQFQIVAYFKSTNSLLCEQLAHKSLSSFRVEKKEFFNCPYEVIKDAIYSTKLALDINENTIVLENSIKDIKLHSNKEDILDSSICPKCKKKMRALKKGGYKCQKCKSIIR